MSLPSFSSELPSASSEIPSGRSTSSSLPSASPEFPSASSVSLSPLTGPYWFPRRLPFVVPSLLPLVVLVLLPAPLCSSRISASLCLSLETPCRRLQMALKAPWHRGCPLDLPSGPHLRSRGHPPDIPHGFRLLRFRPPCGSFFVVYGLWPPVCRPSTHPGYVFFCLGCLGAAL